MSVSGELKLSDKDMDAVLCDKFLKVPDRTGIVRGARFSMSVKIGGRMELSMVRCKGEPFQRVLKNGKKVWCVDVFGYGVRGAVYISKLRERTDTMDNSHG